MCVLSKKILKSYINVKMHAIRVHQRCTSIDAQEDTAMEDSSLIELIEFTDPYCTWCWGSEPVLRKIEEVYGEQVKISYTMGGLVADMDTFHDSVNRIGGSKWYEQVAAHWVDASKRHGMPVDEKVFFDLKDSRFSTHPACIAYKSAQLQNEELANRFLRRMREGTAAERRDIQRLDVQTELIEETGLKADRFVEDIRSGKRSCGTRSPHEKNPIHAQ